MNRLIIPLSLLLILGIVLAGGFAWWKKVSGPVDIRDSSKESLLITRGMTAEQVGKKLEENGLISSALAFKMYVQLTGKTKDIQAGEFLVSKSYSIAEVVDSLSGPAAELWVTIPEGLRREEIVERFIDGLEMEPARADDFRGEFLMASSGLEGQLFPDTYLFPPDASASAVIAKMTNLFEQKIATLSKGPRVANLTRNQLVTLASIIERETKTDSERPIVAGIFINRLNDGIAIQADATVQYALANLNCTDEVDCTWWVTPTRADLEINSPFNTYKFSGIPPSAIASPGFSSLSAAFNPTQTDYYYYIHDADGVIHYAETLGDHNQNIRQYLGR